MDEKLEIKIAGQYFHASLAENSICVMRECVDEIAVVNFNYPGLEFINSLLWPTSQSAYVTVESKEFNGDIDLFKVAARELVGDVDSCG